MGTKVRKLGLLVGALCACLIGTATSAEAALILRLTSGANTVQVQGANGLVNFAGALDSFIINVTTGLSKPVVGPAELDLFSVNVSGGSGTLTIELTDTDYTFGIGGDGSLAWLWTGLIFGGSATAQGWKNLDNLEFGLGPITTGLLGPFSGAFASSGSVGHGILTDPYSMTIRLIYTATGPTQIYSGTFSLSNVPEPAELLLFGLGLTVVGLVARRRRRTQ